MTTSTTEQLLPQNAARLSAPSRNASIIGSHFAIDWLSFVIVALMPVLAAREGLSDDNKAWLLATGGLASGLIQPIVAILSDRYGWRWLGTLGFLLAVIAVSALPYVHGIQQLILLQLVATAGIGAFHPIATAAVGHLAGRKRKLAIGFFFVAGMLGGVGGNLTSPVLIQSFSLNAISLLAIPGLIAVGIFAVAMAYNPPDRTAAVHHHRSMTSRQRADRWWGVTILYCGNVIRFTVNMMLIYLLIEWSEEHTLAAANTTALTEELGQRAAILNGPLQAALQVGMGSAGIIAGWRLATHHERSAMFVVPLVGAVAIILMPIIGSTITTMLALSIISGVGFGAMIPVSIALAQRLVPHWSGFASAMMMGGGWCVAAIGPKAAKEVEHHWNLDVAFYATAALLLVACLVGPLLPKDAIHESASHDDDR